MTVKVEVRHQLTIPKKSGFIISNSTINMIFLNLTDEFKWRKINIQKEYAFEGYSRILSEGTVSKTVNPN